MLNDYSVLYNNVVCSVICERLYFTDMMNAPE